MTRLILALLCAATLPAAVPTLYISPIPGGVEESPKVITYAELVANQPTPIANTAGYRITVPIQQGTMMIRPLGTSGAGTPVANGNILNGTNELVWTPPANVNGSACVACDLVAVNGSNVVISTTGLLLVQVENTPDPMSLQAGEFVQPTAPKVTEDTAYTFTFAQIIGVMQVETNGDPYRLRITAPATGSLGITPPLFLSSGQSLTWTPPPNAYTMSHEPGLAAFTVQVEHPDGSNTSAGAVFSTPIVGVAETVPSDDTIDSVDPLVVDRGIACEFTYEQLVAKLHGYTDLDRDAGLFLNLTSTGIPSMSVWWIEDGVLYAATPASVGIHPGYRLRILIPDTQAFGSFPIAEWTMVASYGGGANATCPNPIITIRNPDSGGSSTNGGGSSGGSCGLGAAGGLLMISMLSLRRARRACAR